MNLLTIQSGIAQGILWAVLTVGVYLTYRILDVADLTVEGTFPLGAAVTVMLINAGMNPFLATFIAVLCGAVAGLCTGVLHTVFKIPAILSGILTMIALYSVNIRIMNDKATVAIAGNSVKHIILKLFPANMNPNIATIIVGVIVSAVLIALLYLFFGTELGSNMKMARALGINTDWMIILGLMISNALIALSGSLIAQFDYGSALVNMGQGTIVIGLASVIIGEVIFIHKERSFAFKLTAVIIGAIIYRTIIALALTIKGFKATDLKLITAIIVAIALAIPVFKTKISFMRHKSANKQGR